MDGATRPKLVKCPIVGFGCGTLHGHFIPARLVLSVVNYILNICSSTFSFFGVFFALQHNINDFVNTLLIVSLSIFVFQETANSVIRLFLLAFALSRYANANNEALLKISQESCGHFSTCAVS